MYIPSESNTLVVKKIKEIEKQVRLNHLGKDLSNLGKFVTTAYLEVKKYPYLQENVWKGIIHVNELCHDTKKTLDTFNCNSCDAVQCLQRAYVYLNDDQEAEALKTLVDLQKISNEMRNEACALSNKCREQLKNVEGVRDKVIDDMKHHDEDKKKELKEEHIRRREEIESCKKEIGNTYLEQLELLNEEAIKKWYGSIALINQKHNNMLKIQKAAVESLAVAIYPFHRIELIMKNIEDFWIGLETLCISMWNSMHNQVEKLTNKEPQQRKAIWLTNAFKRDSLMFYVKCIALKEVCTTAQKSVCSTVDEIQNNVDKNSNEDEALQFIQEIAKESRNEGHLHRS